MRRLLILLVLMLTPSVCFAQASVRTLAGVNAQTGTSYTITAVDQTKLLTFNNTNPVAVTLPSPANTNFGIGAIFSVRNLGTGRVTITPTSSTIDNAATLILDPGQGADIYSDGTNYETQRGSGLGLFGSTNPTGSCVNGSNYTNTTTGILWICQAGTWVVSSGGGGGGSPSVGANGAVQLANGSGLFTSSGNVFDLNSLFQVNEDQQNKGPNPVGADIRAFGGVSYNQFAPPAAAGITGSCNGTTTITLSAASLFVNGAGIAILGCGATNALSTPGAPTVTTNLAQTGTGTGSVVAGLTGATTYNYKIAAQDLGMGITAASAAGSVTTGPTSLGFQTITLTSCARSNATVTCLTSSAHGLTVGAQARLRGVADTSFIGDWNVATVPDNTHFTFADRADTRNGATAATTGGTVTYWPCNHLTWSAVTNAYRYLIYSDRGSPGTFNLVGISKPSYPGEAITNGSLYWDDFGSQTTYGTPPWTVPATAPASATNDTLVTTIISGGTTTTLVVANSASQTLAGTPVRADNAPCIKAAAQSNSTGLVWIPAGNGSDYVTNSILDLSQISSGVSINTQAGNKWGDTVIFGNKGGLFGKPLNIPGGSGSFAPGSYPEQFVFGMPGFQFIGPAPFGVMSNLQLDGESNGQTVIIMSGGGGQAVGWELNNMLVSGPGGTDDMFMPVHIRGNNLASGQLVSKGRLALAVNQSESNSNTPSLFVDDTGTLKLEETFFSGRGPLFMADTSGSQIFFQWFYCQGCNTPLITTSGPRIGGGRALINLSVDELVNDTGASPIIANLNSSGSPQLNLYFGYSTGGNTGFSGAPTFYTFSPQGFGQQNVSSESVSAALTGSGGAIDGIFNTFAGGAGTYATKQYNAGLSTSNSYPIFVTGSVMAAPVLALSAGGSVPTGNQTYTVAPVWPGGGSGPNSLSATINVTTGNQTVGLTWTPLGAAGGCSGYVVMRGGQLAQGGQVSGCASSTFSDASSITVGQGTTVTSGGPSELMPQSKGIATTNLTLNNDVTLSTQGGGTAYTVNFPINQPTSGNTFLSCTAANPANCSWASGGAGFPWNQIGNPTGNFTPSMAGFTSVFSYTSALSNAFEWANSTAATVTTSQSSPQISLCGNAWNGASVQDCLTIQDVPGNGVNAPITDIYGHFGTSTGVVTSQFPGPIASGAGSGAAGALILPQGTSNPTSTSAITIQGAGSITPYSIALPATAPVSTSNFLSCTSATASICSWQNGFGVGNGAGPVMGYYVSPQCPTVDPDGFCFNTPANTRIDTTCTWTNASTTVTCTDTPFVSGDVGKQVMGWATCQTDDALASYGGSITSGTTAVTISTFTDSNHVVLSATPANTQSGTPSCFVYGNNDDTAMGAVEAVATAQKAFCPKVFLAAGNYLITKPGILQIAQPPGCAALPQLQLASTTYGNVELPAGFELEGRGAGTTTIHIANNFPNGAGKISISTPTFTGTSWFNIPALGGWRDFGITGDGQAGTCAGITGGDNLIYMGVGKMNGMLFSNFCAIPGNTTGNLYLTQGIVGDSQSQFNLVNLSAWGGIGIRAFGAGSTSNGYQLSIENEGTDNLHLSMTAGTPFVCKSCYITGSCTYNVAQSGAGFGVVAIDGGSALYMTDTLITNAPIPGCNTQSGSPVLINTLSSGGIHINLQNVFMVISNAGVNNNVNGLYCQTTATCTVSAINTQFSGGSSGSRITLKNTTDTFLDQGGNTLGGPGVAAGSFPFIADGHSLTASCTGVATASSTLGLYNTEMNPTNTTTTCTSTTVGGGWVVTQARTLGELLVSSTAAGVNASSGVVTVLVNGVASALTCTIGTGTSCAGGSSVAVNPGDRVSIQFTTQAADTLAGVKAFFWWQ